MNVRFNNLKLVLNAITDTPNFLYDSFTVNQIINATGLLPKTVYNQLDFLQENFNFFTILEHSPKIHIVKPVIKKFCMFLRGLSAERTYYSLWKGIENLGLDKKVSGQQTNICHFT